MVYKSQTDNFRLSNIMMMGNNNLILTSQSAGVLSSYKNSGLIFFEPRRTTKLARRIRCRYV